MYEFVLIVAGMILGSVIEWVIKRHLKRGEQADIAAAEKVIASHGIISTLYLPSAGQSNSDLKLAIDRLSTANHIFLDRDGNVVGKIASKVGQSPILRLVVDNTK